MRVWIDAAGEDVSAARIDNLVLPVGDVTGDRSDRLAVD
jgi:hypothetical protein